MYVSFRWTVFPLKCYYILFLSLAFAHPANSLPANISNRPSFPSSQPNFLPASLLSDLKNTTSPLSLRSSGCYKPAPSYPRVTPQDAIIALGELARIPDDLYAIRTFRQSAVLRLEGTAVILLVQVGKEKDYFSIYDVLMQAFNIVDHCIVQQWKEEQLGGEIEVGTGDKFRVAVMGRL
ncbi:MAG: hypothetical protein Q9224_005563 [Gallowayella concinna]